MKYRWLAFWLVFFDCFLNVEELSLKFRMRSEWIWKIFYTILLHEKKVESLYGRDNRENPLIEEAQMQCAGSIATVLPEFACHNGKKFHYCIEKWRQVIWLRHWYNRMWYANKNVFYVECSRLKVYWLVFSKNLIKHQQYIGKKNSYFFGYFFKSATPQCKTLVCYATRTYSTLSRLADKTMGFSLS